MKKILFITTVLLFGLAACDVQIKEITLNYSTVEITVGSSQNLIATVIPRGAHQGVTWTSSNTAVATIATNGKIGALSPGVATITVTTINGTKSATAKVTVTGKTEATQGGVIINGLEWATRNVATPGTFVENPEDTGMLFQWNRRTGWSSTNPMVSSDGDTRWNNTSVAGTVWKRENDPCPTGWRVPNEIELRSLVNAGSVWTSRNGINGRLFYVAPNQLFLPVNSVRLGNAGRLRFVGESGYYWSRTQRDSRSTWFLGFSYGGVGVGANWRKAGFSVRCVAE